MRCSDIRRRIRKDMAEGKLLRCDDSLLKHIRCCELCRSVYNDAAISAGLREMPLPEPHDDFVARAIRHAVETNRMQRKRALIGISAAAVMIIFAGAVFLRGAPDWSRRPPSAFSPDKEVAVSCPVETTIRVVIEAVETRRNATLSIDLAENVFVKNYPGHRQLTWRTDLSQGRNLLELPLILKDEADGYVDIRYRYNGMERAVHIPVQANGTRKRLKTVNNQHYS